MDLQNSGESADDKDCKQHLTSPICIIIYKIYLESPNKHSINVSD